VPTPTIDDEPIDSHGAASLYHAAVDELERRYGGVDDGPLMDTGELSPPLGLFLVARVDTDLAGCVGVRPIGEPAEHLGEVKRLWVRPDLRRAGVAAALMDEIVRRTRSLGYRRLYLETGPAQPEALAFYAKIGWIPVAEFPSGAFTHHAAHRFTLAL
jgi:GNAT superfamily N-acetyltransferase